ncbi:MAG: virulence factor [Anaerolineales bacterium]|nr:virulence factor [Chloroflexota bacterium]MBL6983005.1 virulence factor [Anaerolineales bacterium]
MAKYKILCWHGIPCQVRATDENGRANKRLSDRFQVAIDSAAMALGIIGSDEYTDGFRWDDEIEIPGTAYEVADSIVSELEIKYQRIDWKTVAAKLENK